VFSPDAMDNELILKKFIRRLVEERAKDSRNEVQLTTEEMENMFKRAIDSFPKDQLVRVLLYIVMEIDDNMPARFERISKEQITLMKALNKR